MTTNKKYDYRISQNGTSWSAEIIRRVTSKKSAVSKSQDGFASETEAKNWAEKELKSFLDNLAERNKRDSEQHKQKKQDRALREAEYKKSKKD